MRPILFSIGSINIYSYGLMLAIGVISAVVLAEKRAKKQGLSADMVFNLGIMCVVAGIIGAKLLYFITIIPQFAEDFWGTLKNNLTDGFVVYGGVILGVLVGLFYCKKKKVRFLQYFDIAVVSIALGQGFGRIGCFLAGCCYGVETECSIGVHFPEGAYAPTGVALVPTQLISAIADFLLVALLIFLAKKIKTAGKVGAIYIILYGIGRFVIEIWRVEPKAFDTIFSTSQFIALILIPFGLILLKLCDIAAVNWERNHPDMPIEEIITEAAQEEIETEVEQEEIAEEKQEECKDKE